jgi:hypothetical protein
VVRNARDVAVEAAVFGVEIGQRDAPAGREPADKLPQQARHVFDVVQGHRAVDEVEGAGR